MNVGEIISWLMIKIILIFSVTVHEFAHAYTSDKLGDPTARLQDRVSLNPMNHFDPLGFCCMLFLPIGWGKPVPFDYYNLKNISRGIAMIAIAGPISNIIISLISLFILIVIALLIKAFSLEISFVQIEYVVQFFISVITVNLGLAIFNLIPVPPLDGFKISGFFLSNEAMIKWIDMDKYGMYFLFIIIFPIFNGTSIASMIMSPIFVFIQGCFNYILFVFLK